MNRLLRRLGGALLVASAGCAPDAQAPPVIARRLEARGASAAPLPELIVATPRTRFVSGPDRHVVAIPRARLPLRIAPEAPGDGGLVTASAVGGISLTARVPREELGVLVCEAGLVGDHLYAGVGNLLVLGPRISETTFRVRGDVVLRSDEPADKPAFLRVRRVAIDGAIDARRLCARVPPPRHAGTADDPQIALMPGDLDEEDFPSSMAWVDLPGTSAKPLLARPSGDVLVPLRTEADHVPTFGREGTFHRVAVGSGPYAVGWVDGATPAAPPTLGVVGGLLGGEMAPRPGPSSLYRRDLAKLPLRPVLAGTRVDLGGATATLTRPGYARVSRSSGTRSWVNAAVDDDVLVAGWVETSALGAPVDAR
jgi:hypothetical protein